MTISELICRLQAIKCEHGDLRVAVDRIEGGLDDAREIIIGKDEEAFGDEKVVFISRGC